MHIKGVRKRPLATSSLDKLYSSSGDEERWWHENKITAKGLTDIDRSLRNVMGYRPGRYDNGWAFTQTWSFRPGNRLSPLQTAMKRILSGLWRTESVITALDRPVPDGQDPEVWHKECLDVARNRYDYVPIPEASIIALQGIADEVGKRRNRVVSFIGVMGLDAAGNPEIAAVNLPARTYTPFPLQELIKRSSEQT